MRDSRLVAAGTLERTIGGMPVPMTEPPFTTRRTIYGYIDRVNLDPLYATFNFPSPEATAPERPQTMVPQQALFAMNHPFVIDQSRRLAGLPEFAALSASGRMQQGVIHNNDLVANLPFLRVNGNGSIDIAGETLDYTLEVRVLGTPGLDSSALHNTTIPVRITGSLTEPRVRPDVRAVLEGQAREALQRQEQQAREALERREQEARDRAKQELEEEKERAKDRLRDRLRDGRG
jgi:hypothetical protein